jgi:hypothetical protein
LIVQGVGVGRILRITPSQDEELRVIDSAAIVFFVSSAAALDLSASGECFLFASEFIQVVTAAKSEIMM